MKLIARRLAQMVVILAALSFVLFGLLSAMPGDPVDLLITSNPTVKPEDVVRLKKLRGLDKPWTVRYLRWVWGHHEPRRPPKLDEVQPAGVELDDEGRAVVEVDLAPALPEGDALRLTGLFGAEAQGKTLAAPVEGPGRHRLWFTATDRHGLSAVGSVEVWAAPPPGPEHEPPPLSEEEERHLAAGTEGEQAGWSEAELLEAAKAADPGRLVLEPLSPRVVDEPEEFAVELAELFSPVDRPADPTSSEVRYRLLGETPGRIEGGRFVHVYEEPGQSPVLVEVTREGQVAQAAFAVEHGPVPHPERFHRGFLFAFLGDKEALGFSNTYKRPVWEILFGPEVRCGDGLRGPGESCDDGNTVAGDGCSATCHDEQLSFWGRLDVEAAGVLLGSGRILNTLSLMLPALLLSFLLAIPFGVLAAVRQYSWVDYLANFLAFVGISMPVFWLGIMMMALFAEKLNVLPAGGIQTPGIQGGFFEVLLDRLRYTIMPATVLSVAYTGRWLRYMRASMLEVLPLDFVRTARAKGLSRRKVILKHALRNALLPVVTVLALSAPALFGGAVLTEWVFSWPGIGRLQFDAVMSNDYYVAIIVFLVSAALVMVANLLADLLYVVIDPRLRRTGR